MTVGWPSIAASASMPPTPQPTTPSPLTIVVCESVPTTVSGNDHRLAVRSALHDDRGEVLEVHLVHDAGVGRDDAEVAERLLAPAQERVALAVALVLDRRRSGRTRAACRSGRPAPSGRSPGRRAASGLMRVGSPPMRCMASRIAARSTTHGDAGEVLQQHARRHERDLALAAASSGPSRAPRRCARASPIARPRGAADSRAGCAARTADG